MRPNQMPWPSAVLIAGLVMAGAARADVPRLIPYQGLLTDTGGAPLPGPVSLLIRLYNGSGGGATQLFSETQNSVSLVDGVFSVNIGAATGGGVPDSALNATEVWLGISVDGAAELTPRTQLGMVPYAAKGRSAEQLVIPNSFISAASVDATGNVGIGTAAPGAKLHVRGGASLALPTTTETLVSHATDESAGTHSATSQLRFLSTRDFFVGPDNNATGTIAVSNLVSGVKEFSLNAVDTGMSLSLRAQNSEKLAIVAEGARFRSTSATNLLLTGSFDDAQIDFVKNTGTSPSARILFDGFTDPNTHTGSIDFWTRLHPDPLRRRMSITADGRLSVLENGGTETFELRSNFGGTAGAWIQMRATDGTPGISMAARNASTGLGGLIELQNDSGVSTVKLSGDTGSGFGRVTTSVLQITGGSDLAEPFMVNSHESSVGADSDRDSSARIEPGMVVVIDPERPGQLRLSREAYDRKVAGIISGAGGIQPGMVMSQSGSIADGTHQVALTGRVCCKCDTSNGPIEPGDMLTTSETPGHAMRATDHARSQGAVLGKAMTGLDAGRGLVLVLVQPQ